MRRKGLKEIILTVEALEEGHLPSHCVLMLNSVTAEMPDPVRIRLQSGREKWMVQFAPSIFVTSLRLFLAVRVFPQR